MVTDVRLQRLPFLGSLGLLTALLAHEAVYGSSHAAGGPYHAALNLLALTGLGAFAVLTACVAWLGARQADGSILARALRAYLPGFRELAAVGALWFALIERIEPEHAVHAPLLLIIAALAFAAWLISAACRSFARALAAIALAIVARPFAPRMPVTRRLFTRPSSARRTAFVYRRFVRPPPAVMHVPA
jgi:hypothetical protein